MSSPSRIRAAEKCCLSPGAITLQLQKLSRELHTDLFVKRGHRLIPTRDAFFLAERAKALLKVTNQIRYELGSDQTNGVVPFHFGTGVTTLIYQLKKPLRQLRKQYPRVDLRVTVDVTEEIVSGLRERRIDLGLVSLPVPPEHLNIMPLFEEELLVLGPSAGDVRRRIPSMRPSTLADLPLLLYPTSSNVRLIIDQFLRKIGIAPRVVLEAEDTEAIKGLVESGFGYSILPERALRQRKRTFQTYRIEGHRLSRTLALASPRIDYPRKLTESIAQFLARVLKRDHFPV